jgi:hypothetical protein
MNLILPGRFSLQKNVVGIFAFVTLAGARDSVFAAPPRFTVLELAIY